MQSQPDRPNKPALFKALALIFVVLAGFFIAPSVYEIQQARQASDWTPRGAIITHAEVAQYGGGRAHDPPRHAIDMRGRFIATDEEFSVERIAFAQFSSVEEIRRFVKQYPPGSELVVYVSPEDATRVVLIADANITSMLYLIGLGCNIEFLVD